jgi:hypothetical protein
MRPLPPPPHNARAAYLTCISRARQPLRQQLEQHEEAVSRSAERFAEAAQTQMLHTLNADSFGPASQPERTALAKVYTDRMAKEGAPGRQLYDELKIASEICPLCGHHIVTTLDHHLPKSTYPFLSVAPANLIPACSDCNKLKIDISPSTLEEQTLHPYFDNIDDDHWLSARLIEEQPPALVFSVVSPPHWPFHLTARVKHHFTVFRLKKLYSIQGATLLAGIAHDLGELFDAAGADAVREDLDRKARSWAQSQRNGWQAATYNALAASDWYCTGGFAIL